VVALIPSPTVNVEGTGRRSPGRRFASAAVLSSNALITLIPLDEGQAAKTRGAYPLRQREQALHRKRTTITAHRGTAESPGSSFQGQEKGRRHAGPPRNPLLLASALGPTTAPIPSPSFAPRPACPFVPDFQGVVFTPAQAAAVPTLISTGKTPTPPLARRWAPPRTQHPTAPPPSLYPHTRSWAHPTSLRLARGSQPTQDHSTVQ